MYENSRFLRLFAIGCLLIFLSFRVSICENNISRKNAKIVIVGAGPSGIAAASKLMENGFENITILEAENRIGGRVYTTKFGNYSIDLGGQWVHGEVGNVAFELAYPLGLLDKSNKPGGTFVQQEYTDSQGNPLNQDLSSKLSEFYFEKIFEVDVNNISSNFVSVGEYAEKMFDEQFKNNPQMLNDRKKYLDFMEKFALKSDPADSWYKLSFAGGGMYHTCEGDQYINWMERGYSTILDILMKRYPNPNNELPVLNNTILNTEVSSIDYSSEGERPAILIATAKDQIYKADHVIVTVSVGVLKDTFKTLFIPTLPDYKISAIENSAFGSVTKIYLMFDNPFWDVGDRRIIQFSFLWNENDRKTIENDPEKSWLLGLYGATSVEHKPNLMCLWVTGNHSKVMESLPEEKVFKYAVENLHRFLDKKFNVTEPVAMLRSRWYSNPHFKGTYSYRSLEAEERKVYPEMIERPLNSETLKVLFAGEATSEHHFSTVHGAIDSGWKAADRLIGHYKSSNGS